MLLSNISCSVSYRIAPYRTVDTALFMLYHPDREWPVAPLLLVGDARPQTRRQASVQVGGEGPALGACRPGGKDVDVYSSAHRPDRCLLLAGVE